MKAGLQARMSHTMAMTPQLLQSIRLLQLSSLELEQEVQQALEDNVMLESEEEAPEPEAGPVEQAESAAELETPVSGADPQAASRVEADYDWSSRESWSGGEPGDEDGEGGWEARTPAPRQTDARLLALEQLQLVLSSERERRIAETILEAIDDNGYLAEPLDGISMRLGPNFAAGTLEVEAVLEKVQGVEPSGFGARDLRECLLLQLRDRPDTPARDLAEFIVSACIERIADGDWSELMQALELRRAQVEEAVALVLSCNPKPGAASAGEAQAVVPDVLVVGTPGSWRVELNPAVLPRVRVNKTYERMLGSAGAHKALRDQLQEARWLVRGLEMRHMTLLRTARAIFERQEKFLERGEEGMAPLTLREIAEAIGMHESTVCRVTTQKWVQTPWGVYELKALFPSQIAGAVNDVSGTAVKAMIRRIIDTEGRNAPLCDGDIAAILARNGVRVARRTVAKYREAMRILPAKERLAAVRIKHGVKLAG